MAGYRLLRALRRDRGPLTRSLAAMLAGGTVRLVTGEAALAREAAGLFHAGDWITGTHRLRWYLAHGRSGALMRGRPAFDPTTGMDPATVMLLAAWMKGREDRAMRLARLYVLARQAHGARAELQERCFDAYVETAQGLLPLSPPDVTAAGTKGTEFGSDAALAALDSLIQHLALPWYVISGTFLGAVREGNFLTHDYDIDIGINAEHFDEATLLAQISAAPDLVCVNASPARHLEREGTGFRERVWPALYRVMHATGVGIDIFIHHRDGEVIWHGSGKHRWENSAFDLAPVVLAGRTVQGPADADRYLSENYGDWRTPVKRFDCSTGTPNVRFHRNLFAVAEFLRAAVMRPGSADAAVGILVLRQEGYLSQGDTRFVLPWR